MAEGKRGFVLYTDIIHTISKLPNEKAGELFKFILEYVNDKNPETDDIIIQIAFEPIKQSLKRDLERYESRCEKSRANGAKGGRPPKEPRVDNDNPEKTNRLQKEPKKPSGFSGLQKKPKKADSDNDRDNDSDTDKEINIYSDEIRNFTASLSQYFDKEVISKLTKNQGDKWKDCIDKLIRVDGRDKKEIESVVKWARSDEFWSKQFMTILKLRMKDKEEVLYYDKFKNLMPKKLIISLKPKRELSHDGNLGLDRDLKEMFYKGEINEEEATKIQTER